MNAQANGPDSKNNKRAPSFSALFRPRDALKWLGHSAVAAIIVIIGFWLIVPDYDLASSLRLGLLVFAGVFIGGLLFFVGVYAFAKRRSSKAEQ